MWYERADLLLLSSTEETFGMPALEAMAMGCSVVCSDVPALKELCQETAFYCDPLSAASLATGVERALTNKTRPDRILAGRVLARAFTWDRTAKSMAELYCALHTGSRLAPCHRETNGLEGDGQ
jgi:alpha-1,3-rhamnosyl/mannosyltransferase